VTPDLQTVAVKTGSPGIGDELPMRTMACTKSSRSAISIGPVSAIARTVESELATVKLSDFLTVAQQLPPDEGEMKSNRFEVTFNVIKDESRMAETAWFSVSRTDVSLLLAELRDQPPEPFHSPLLEGLLPAAQTLEAYASSQGASPTTTPLGLPAEHAEPFKFWLFRAAVQASRAGDHPKAAALKRIRESMR
jgi:hypothetical protein